MVRLHAGRMREIPAERKREKLVMTGVAVCCFLY